MENKKNEQDYMQLLMHLIRDFVWPTEYMFKFIIPFEADKLNQLRSLFSEDAKISHNESKTSKYISVTALQMMDNPDDVIDIYRKAGEIEKVISL